MRLKEAQQADGAPEAARQERERAANRAAADRCGVRTVDGAGRRPSSGRRTRRGGRGWWAGRAAAGAGGRAERRRALGKAPESERREARKKKGGREEKFGRKVRSRRVVTRALGGTQGDGAEKERHNRRSQ